MNTILDLNEISISLLDHVLGANDYVYRSSTIIEYTFDSFFSKSSLNKKLLNTYLIKVQERNITDCK